jgi:hypothetical protein
MKLLLFLLPLPLLAQTFGVASIKPSSTDGQRLAQALPGGGLRISGMTLKALIGRPGEFASFKSKEGKWG